MRDNTQKLKLALPQSGATNWGEVLNSNFRTIDNAFIKVSSDLAALQSQLGEVGYIHIDDGADCVKVMVDNSASREEDKYLLKIGTFKNNNFTPTKDATGNDVVYNANTLDQIDDFQGFKIANEFTAVEESPTPWNKTWHLGDVMVKYSEIEDYQRVHKFTKIPQTLGGYYKPEFNVDTGTGVWTATWRKQLAEESESEYAQNGGFPIPYTVTGIFSGTLNSLNLSNNNTSYRVIQLSNNIKGEPPTIDCTFMYHDVTNNYWQRCEIDYRLHKPSTSNNWQILIDTSYISGTLSNYRVMVKYYEHRIEENTIIQAQ